MSKTAINTTTCNASSWGRRLAISGRSTFGASVWSSDMIVSRLMGQAESNNESNGSQPSSVNIENETPSTGRPLTTEEIIDGPAWTVRNERRCGIALSDRRNACFVWKPRRQSSVIAVCLSRTFASSASHRIDVPSVLRGARRPPSTHARS